MVLAQRLSAEYSCSNAAFEITRSQRSAFASSRGRRQHSTTIPSYAAIHYVKLLIPSLIHIALFNHLCVIYDVQDPQSVYTRLVFDQNHPILFRCYVFFYKARSTRLANPLGQLLILALIFHFDLLLLEAWYSST